MSSIFATYLKRKYRKLDFILLWKYWVFVAEGCFREMVALFSHWHTLGCSLQLLFAFRTSKVLILIFIPKHSVKKQEYFLFQQAYFSFTAAMDPFSLLMIIKESIKKHPSVLSWDDWLYNSNSIWNQGLCTIFTIMIFSTTCWCELYDWKAGNLCVLSVSFKSTL